MGSVSARTAISQGPNDEWSSHSAVSEIENDEYAYIEIEVPEDTDRLDIVLTWDEPPNDNVGSAVMADLDLTWDRMRTVTSPNVVNMFPALERTTWNISSFKILKLARSELR